MGLLRSRYGAAFFFLYSISQVSPSEDDKVRSHRPWNWIVEKKRQVSWPSGWRLLQKASTSLPRMNWIDNALPLFSSVVFWKQFLRIYPNEWLILSTNAPSRLRLDPSSLWRFLLQHSRYYKSLMGRSTGQCAQFRAPRMKRNGPPGGHWYSVSNV